MSDSGERKPQDVNHVVLEALGGSSEARGDAPPGKKRKPIGSPRLKVLNRIVDEPVDWMPREGLPAGGREECRNGERPCPYVRCKWHLWLVLSEDRAGRPWRDSTPRHADGRWIETGEAGGRRAPTTLLPAWLEYPTPACCALDIVEQLEGENAAIKRIAEAMHLSIDSVFRIIRMGKQKLTEQRMQRLRELREF